MVRENTQEQLRKSRCEFQGKNRTSTLASPTCFFKIGSFASVLILALSFAAEFIWDIPICVLCKIQRLLYLPIGGLCIFGLYSNAQRKILRLVELCILMALLVASYHVITIAGIVPDTCNRHLSRISSEIDFKEHLARLPACSKSTWNLFGIPATLYNASFLTLLVIWIERIFLKFTRTAIKNI